MSRPEFLLALERSLELPPGSLHGSELLDDLAQWNSLALIDYLALADENGVSLSPREVRNCRTVQDLAQLAKIT